MRKAITLLCLLIGIGWASAQTKVSGTVISADDGQPVIGATVLVKGTSTGTITDANGKYSINLPANAKTLIFSYVGMTTVEQEAKSGMKIVLQSDSKQMSEVVVTALGISKEKKSLGYAVQDVKGDKINDAQTGNVLSALSGKVAGVNITSAAGAAGAASFVNIRGQNSIIGNNQPLFVVDGVPIDNSMEYSGNPDNLSNNLLEGVNYSNRAIDINPDDIETISVLKGGAATALYGMKAANGVVLISTKKGKNTEGKIQVSLSSSVGLDDVNKLPKMQYQYAQGTGGVYKTSTPYSWGPKISSSNSQASNAYNNADTFFLTGITLNNNLTLSGGSKTNDFLVAIGNMKQDGIIPNNTFKKTSIKLSGDTKLGDKIIVSGSFNYINSGGTRMQQGSNLSGVMLGLLRCSPSFDISNGHGSNGYKYADAYEYLEDGSQRTYYAAYDNPYWTVNKNKFKDDVDRVLGNLSASYKPLKELTFTYKIGTDFYSDKRDGHIAINSNAYSTGQIQLDNHFKRIINSDLTANFSKEIAKDLSASVTLGQNMYQNYYRQVYSEGDGLSVPDFYNISNASSFIDREYTSEYRTAALYADVQLAYRNMLYLGLTGRNEWSTTLPKSNNSFFYPSTSLGFIFTELPQLKGNKILTYGKIRASYAQIANQPEPYYTSNTFSSAIVSDGWASGISSPFGGNSGYFATNTLAAQNLKPERLISREIGLELKFFNNRISIDASYYNNQNKDLLLPVPLTGSSGYNAIYMNAATMENKGVEIMASVIPVKNRNFSWTLTGNFSMNKNKVLSLADGVSDIFLGGFTGIEVRVVKGQPYGSIYSTSFLKDSNGNLVINDDKTSAGYGYPIKDDNMKSLGSVAPKWTLGITNEFSYKGASLSFLVDIKKGGLMWNGTKSRTVGFGTSDVTLSRGQSVVFAGVKGHYDSDGNLVTSGTNNISTTYSEYYFKNIGGGSNPAQEQFVEKTDWVRLREVSLSYQLGQILKPAFLRQLKVYATGRNLLLWTPYTGIDPETNLMGASNAQGLDYFNMPNTRSIVFGVKYDF
jgi:TonB-linked SusC/RagA family outer membrane protein